MWFKCTLDKSGAVLSCEAVEIARQDKTLVLYIDAPNKGAACAEAKRLRAQQYKDACAKHGVALPARPKRVTVVIPESDPTRRPIIRRLPVEPQFKGPGAQRVKALRECAARFDKLGAEPFREWLSFEIAAVERVLAEVG